LDKRKERGNAAEKAAREYLQKKGMQLVQCNFRCRWGEIDIIARDGDYLVFVEVRSQWGKRGVSPEEWVTRAKQKRLRKLALYYLQKEVGREISCRLDLLTVLMNPSGGAGSFNHFKGVF